MDLVKYNQRILAITGTIILVVLIVVVIMGATALVIELVDDVKTVDTRLLAENPTKSDTASYRLQNVTFEQPVQVDTSRAIYLIPVDQVNLKNPKHFNNIEAILDYETDYRFESYYGLYNNFILINFETDLKKQLFDKKMAISEWAFVKIKDTSSILFMAADADSNKDNVLDDKDFKKLYAYYPDEDILKEYTFEGRTVLRLQPLDKTVLVSILTGMDKDGDNGFDYLREPTKLYSLNIMDKTIAELVPEQMNKRLQQIIDN